MANDTPIYDENARRDGIREPNSEDVFYPVSGSPQRAAYDAENAAHNVDSISDEDEAEARERMRIALNKERLVSGGYAGGVTYDVNSAYPDVPADQIPPMARTVGYMLAAAYAVSSPFALGLPAILAPEQAGMIAQVWGIIGTAVAGYAGFVGVKYRPTR